MRRWLWALWVLWWPLASQGWIDQDRLIEQAVLKNYNRKHRPVKVESTVMQVEVFLMINHVEKVDEKEQTILLHGQISASWMDEYLTWDPSTYNGTTMIAVDTWKIWQPSFALYNSARSNGWYLYMQGVPATVLSNGRVYSSGSFSFHVTCYFDFTNYPYDEQECPVVIADWVYDLSKINLSDPVPNYLTKPVIRLSFDPAESGPKKHVAGWELQDSWRKHCYWGPVGCLEGWPTGSLDTYWSLLEFGIKLKRHAPYFWITILLPEITATVLTLAVFWIDDYPMAQSVSMMCVLLQGLCAWGLLKQMPPANGYTPKIVYFFAANLILAAVAFIVHCFFSFLIDTLPGDIEFPFQLTNLTEKLREVKFFKVEGLSFDPQRVLLGEEGEKTPNGHSCAEEAQPREEILIEMEEPGSSQTEAPPAPVAPSSPSPNPLTEAEVFSKHSESPRSHLAEELYTLRRVIFAAYVLVIVVLVPWLLC